MSEEFSPLEESEVIEVEHQPISKQLNLSSYFSFLTLTVNQFTTAIEDRVSISDELRNQIFEEGVDCEVLKFGSKDWQKGKIRVKMTVEFCPDEPEEIEEEEAEESENGESEDSDFDSLDDLRKELNQ